jgi:uncharacterized protein (DUF302 family)
MTEELARENSKKISKRQYDRGIITRKKIESERPRGVFLSGFKENMMAYYYNKTVKAGFDEAVSRIKQALKDEGFGILTEIDVSDTLKKKLDVEFRNYRILGACNPPFAYRALQAEDKIGTMLPCNVVVQEKGDGGVELAAINPVASMQAVDNPDLREIADAIGQRLKKIIQNA